MADTQLYLAGEVNDNTIRPLIQTVSDRVGAGSRSVLLAISSPGGNIYWGVTAYNFLRGLGVEVITHNVGQVDSIAGVLFCAGERRYCVPQGRFLIHGVAATFQGTNPSLGERDLRSRLANLEQNRETIASILAARTGKDLEQVKADMLNEVIMNAAEGQDYGFVTEIKTEVFDPAQEVLRFM